MDQIIEFWVQNIPYFISREGKFLSRNYMSEKKFPKKFEKCYKLFLSHSRGSELNRTYFLEGRHFYLVPEIKLLAPRTGFHILRENSKLVVNRLPQMSTKWCDLSLLICSIFNFKKWSIYVKKREYCNTPELCTRFGNKLATSLVRIASTRIFSEPEQSIIELPVNSLDAYNIERGRKGNTGKFGLGFFSIFYWLFDCPERNLEIISYYVKKGRFRSFKCIVRYSGDRFIFNLNDFRTNVRRTGTRMFLNAENKNFSPENLVNFKKQMEKLRYTRSSIIITRSPDSKEFKIFNKCLETEDRIIVEYNKNGILVEDYATGIDLKILITKLFTPSISSKTIRMSSSPQIKFKNLSRVEVGKVQNLFILLVNNVTVVRIIFNTKIEKKYNIIVALPGNTRVPVSRDDVIFNAQTRIDFEESTSKISEKFIEIGNYYTFWEGFNSYCNYTSSTENRKFVLDILNKFRSGTKNKYLFISYKFIRIFNQFDDLGVRKLIYGESDFEKLEIRIKHSKKKNYDKIFLEKKVFILKNIKEIITSTGLYSYIFVDLDFTKKFKDWPIQLSFTSIREYLILFSQKKNNIQITEEIFTKYGIYWRENKNKHIRNLENQLVLKCETLNNFYVVNFPPVQLFKFSDFLNQVDSGLNIYFITRMINILNKLNPVLTYSGGKPSFYSNYDSPLLKGRHDVPSLDKIKVSEKLKTFNREWVRYMLFWDETKADFFNSFAFNPISIMWNRKFRIYNDEDKYSSWVRNKLIPKTFRLYENCFEMNIIYQFFLWLYLNIPQNLDKVNDEYSMYKKLVGYSEIPNIISKLYDLDKINLRKLINFLLKSIQFQSIRGIESLYPKPIKIYKISALSGFCVDYSIFDRIFISFKLYLNEIIQIPSLPKISYSHVFQTPGYYPYSFTESKLIQYVITEKFTGIKNLFSNLSKFSLSDTDFVLQIAEIAINEGSTKTFIESMITETVQNSLDAIKIFNPSKKFIDIELQEINSYTLLFSITDYVGMKENAVISMMIPFLSSKTPSELITGEMGSGFFNIYRNSKQVLITTVSEGTKIQIFDIPISKKGRVVDIKRNTLIEETKESNYTKIQVMIEEKDIIKYNEYISNVKFTIENVISLIHNAKIRFNGLEVKISTQQIYENQYFQLYAREPDEILFNSYIFTKGVPFYGLQKYFSGKNIVQPFVTDFLKSNLVLNIKHGLFTPVQTRAKLNISPENMKILTKFLYESLYLSILYFISHGIYVGDLNSIIPNFTDSASLGQLLFSNFEYENPREIQRLTRFMINYSYSGNIRIKDLIDEAYKIIGNNFTFKYTKDILETSQHNEILRDLITKLRQLTPDLPCIRVVLLWLSYKNKINKKDKKKSDKSIDDMTDVERKYKKTKDKFFSKNTTRLEKIFQKFINLYWKFGLKLKIPKFENKKIPQLSLDKIGPNTLGYYQPHDHSMHLNLNSFKYTDFQNFQKFFENKNIQRLRNNKIYKDWVSLERPATTLIHELLHAILNSNHTTGGIHDDLYFKFREEEKPVLLTFDEVANKIFIRIFRSVNFIEEWFDN